MNQELEGSGHPRFSPDGRLLVTGSADAFRAWKVGTWERLWEVRRGGEHDHRGRLAFSPDGRLLAVASTPWLVRLLDPADGAEVATLTAPNAEEVGEMTFSPDGSRLAVATESLSVQLWDLRAVRARLAETGLDWDAPPCPPAPAETEPPRVEVLPPPMPRAAGCQRFSEMERG